MDEIKNEQLPVSEADGIEECEIETLDDLKARAQEIKDADELGEDEIITFGVNDDKKKKVKFLEDKIDTTKADLDADNYDIHIPIAQPEDADARIAGKTPIRIFYDMNADEVTEGLKRFHKLTLYSKNLIYSIILLVLFILYVYRITTAEPGTVSSMQYFLAVVSVAMIGFIWYMPTRHIKATKEAVTKEKNTFMVDVYDTCVMVGEEGNQTMVDFEMIKPRVIGFETSLNFCIGVGKERIFIIPKRCTEGREDAVRACLQEGFKDKYKNFTV